MDQRVQFIGDWLKGRYTKIDLCEFYGISRPTGDKWIQRYERLGVDGLKALSRAARTHPNATDPALRERIVQYKLCHQRWGPKKAMEITGGETTTYRLLAYVALTMNLNWNKYLLSKPKHFCTLKAA